MEILGSWRLFAVVVRTKRPNDHRRTNTVERKKMKKTI